MKQLSVNSNYYKIIVLSISILLCACQSKVNKTETNLGETNTPKKKEIVHKTIDSLNIKTDIIYGIDISKYQGDEIAFLDKKTDSLQFIICKATEGITYIDPDFKHNWAKISEKNFIRGSYHFYRSNDDPIAQARNYINALTTIQKTDFPPIIDFEEGGIDQSQSVTQIQTTLHVFINEIEKKLKRKPIIYTDVNTGNKYLNKTVFSNYPLWIANYNNRDQPELPTAWQGSKWVLWQKSASYKIGATLNDFDIFNGSLIDLKKFIKTTDTP